VKASYGTAGRAVRQVETREQERQAIRDLSGDGGPVIGQAPAPGRYGQVQALFEHGRLVAAHTSVGVGAGAGGSAAARLSVDHPAARDYSARLGAYLCWHGGLTLDYFHVDDQPQFIECNPRTVEPANAAQAGVDLPGLTIALSAGRPLPAQPVIGRPGIRTRGALAPSVPPSSTRPARPCSACSPTARCGEARTAAPPRCSRPCAATRRASYRWSPRRPCCSPALGARAR